MFLNNFKSAFLISLFICAVINAANIDPSITSVDRIQKASIKDCNEAIAIAEKYCNEGDLNACYSLSISYKQGKCVRRDYEIAKNYEDKLAETAKLKCLDDDINACRRLATSYEYKKIFEEIKPILLKMCEAGSLYICDNFFGAKLEDETIRQSIIKNLQEKCNNEGRTACLKLADSRLIGLEEKENLKEKVLRDYENSCFNIQNALDCEYLLSNAGYHGYTRIDKQKVVNKLVSICENNYDNNKAIYCIDVLESASVDQQTKNEIAENAINAVFNNCMENGDFQSCIKLMNFTRHPSGRTPTKIPSHITKDIHIQVKQKACELGEKYYCY